MSKIDKLSIRGIRSFSPDSQEIVTFFTPLTLIVGHNGSGKTTIIECLKYITTGDLPPGSKGGAFVHDPKMAHESEIKAQIKLKFVAVNGKEVVCQRAIQLTQKRAKTEMKTLEGLILTRDPETGEQQSLNKKCAQLDAEMPNLLGVSKPILENVIFCHQEESSWPLSDPSTLKKKFDEIFESTKYAKALDELKQKAKKQAVELKLEEKEVQYLQKEREKSEKMKKQIGTIEDKIQASKTHSAELDDEIEEVIQLTSSTMADFQQAQLFENKLSLLNKELSLISNSYSSLMEKLREEGYDGEYDSMAQEEISNLLKQKSKEFQEIEEALAKNKQEKEAIEKQLDLLNNKLRSKLIEKSRIDNNKTVMLQKQKQLLEIIPVQSQDMTLEEVLDSEIESLEREIRRKKETFNETEREIQDRIVRLKSMLKSFEDQIAIKKKQKKELSIKLQNVTHQWRNIEIPDIETVNTELKEISDKLGVDLNALQMQLKVKQKEYEEKKERNEKDIVLLKKELAEAVEHGEIQLKVDIKRQEIDELKKEISKLNVKMQDEFDMVKSSVSKKSSLPDINHFKEIENVYKKTADLKRGAEKECLEIEKKLEVVKNNIKTKESLHEDNRKKRTELTNFLKRKYDTLDVKPLIEEVEDKISKAESLGNVSVLVEKSLRNKKCVLCDSTGEKIMQIIESKKETNDLETLRLRKKQLENDYVKYQLPLEAIDISAINKELDDLKAEVSNLIEQRDDIDVVIVNHKMSLDSFENLMKLNGELEKIKQGLSKKENELKSLQSKTGGTKRSVQECNEALERLSKEIESKRNEYDSELAQFNRIQNEQLTLQNKKQRLEAERLKIQTKIQEKRELEAEKSQLSEQLSSLDVQSTQEPASEEFDRKEELTELETNLTSKKKSFDKELSELNDSLNKSIQNRNKLVELRREIKELEKQSNDSGLSQETQQIESEINRLKNITIEDDTSKVRNLLAIINRLKNFQSLHSISKQVEDKKQEIKTLKFGEFKKFKEVEEYKKVIDQLKNLQSQKTAERASLEGEIKILSQQLVQLKEDFDDKIEEKYKQQLIKYTTLDLCMKDVEKYRQALDKAIMKYHSMQMTNLNRLIRDLWTKVYKGNDIDSIEIRQVLINFNLRSDAENLKGNRSYNYRVVMIKGNTEIDMRGRSSAGQRMLCSIIIRLALAETFCVKCGILALDEPTTNLDEANISSLAEALHEIVIERKKQANFQLIVITHDETFLEKIGREAEYYFRVKKDHQQFSRVEMVKIE